MVGAAKALYSVLGRAQHCEFGVSSREKTRADLRSSQSEWCSIARDTCCGESHDLLS
jgi:hypothetical protein